MNIHELRKLRSKKKDEMEAALEATVTRDAAGESEADDQRTAALHERFTRELVLAQQPGHHAPPFAITAAAFWIAVRILGYVPQRQR